MEALGRPELWTIRTHLFPWPFSIANSSARGFRWIQDMQSLSVYLKCIIKTWTFPQTQLPHLPFIRKINLAFGRDVFLTPSNHLFSSVKTLWFFSKFRCRSRSNPGDSPIFSGVLVHPTPKKNIASVLVFCYLVLLYIK